MVEASDLVTVALDQLLPRTDGAESRLIEAMRYAALGPGTPHPALLRAGDRHGCSAVPERSGAAHRLRPGVRPRLQPDPRRPAGAGRRRSCAADGRPCTGPMTRPRRCWPATRCSRSPSRSWPTPTPTRTAGLRCRPGAEAGPGRGRQGHGGGPDARPAWLGRGPADCCQDATHEDRRADRLRRGGAGGGSPEGRTGAPRPAGLSRRTSVWPTRSSTSLSGPRARPEASVNP